MTVPITPKETAFYRRALEDVRRMFIAATVRELVQELIDDQQAGNAYDVNHGLCSIFAQNLRDELSAVGIPSELYYDRDACHWYVVVLDRFYDAETPEGVLSVTELGFYKGEKNA